VEILLLILSSLTLIVLLLMSGHLLVRCVGWFLLISAVVSVLLPTVSHGPRHSPKTQSLSNLRQIGVAVLVYAARNGGQFPDTFATLLLGDDDHRLFDGWIFVSPGSKDTPAIGATGQEIARDLAEGGHLSYIYTGRGVTSRTAIFNTVVAYERPGIWPDGGAVLYGDGHAEFVPTLTLNLIAARRDAGIFPVTTSQTGAEY